MNHRDRSIIDGVRQRALLADQKRKALLEQRRELDATISALTEATDLSKGEIEKISADVQREVFKEESGHGRSPTVLGATLVVALSWGTLVLFSESDETTYAAAIPMQAAASARSSNAATPLAAGLRSRSITT